MIMEDSLCDIKIKGEKLPALFIVQKYPHEAKAQYTEAQ